MFAMLTYQSPPVSVGVYVLYGENREWLVLWFGVAVTMGSPQKNCLSHLSLELGWCGLINGEATQV